MGIWSEFGRAKKLNWKQSLKPLNVIYVMTVLTYWYDFDTWTVRKRRGQAVLNARSYDEVFNDVDKNKEQCERKS